MIKTFSNKYAQKIFNRQYVPHYPNDINRVILRKLLVLHCASSLKDLMIPPGNRLEKLNSGLYSIRINDQWRICFKWIDNNAYQVEIIDYH